LTAVGRSIPKLEADDGLTGGASLQPEQFLTIVRLTRGY
jgi:hypothetical protein